MGPSRLAAYAGVRRLIPWLSGLRCLPWLEWFTDGKKAIVFVDCQSEMIGMGPSSAGVRKRMSRRDYNVRVLPRGRGACLPSHRHISTRG
jgi:hypothetical protein